jgi:hypothetical protein
MDVNGLLRILNKRFFICYIPSMIGRVCLFSFGMMSHIRRRPPGRGNCGRRHAFSAPWSGSTRWRGWISSTAWTSSIWIWYFYSPRGVKIFRHPDGWLLWLMFVWWGPVWRGRHHGGAFQFFLLMGMKTNICSNAKRETTTRQLYQK